MAAKKHSKRRTAKSLSASKTDRLAAVERQRLMEFGARAEELLLEARRAKEEEATKRPTEAARLARERAEGNKRDEIERALYRARGIVQLIVAAADGASDFDDALPHAAQEAEALLTRAIELEGL